MHRQEEGLIAYLAHSLRYVRFEERLSEDCLLVGEQLAALGRAVAFVQGLGHALVARYTIVAREVFLGLR